MPPTIALRPMHQLLPIIDEIQRFGFDVGVQPLFNQRFDFARRGVSHADVNLFQIAAGAVEIEFVGTIG